MIIKSPAHRTLYGRRPRAPLHPGRDLGTPQRWLRSGDFGAAAGQQQEQEGIDVVTGRRWARVDLEKILRGVDGVVERHDDDGGCSRTHATPTDPAADLERLRERLAADAETEVLELVGETPTEAAWGVLGSRVRGVRWLLVEAGFEEDWVDAGFPLGWPLELLVVSSAGGDLVGTPAVLEGRVPHLVLVRTCNLRFEGPGNEVLDRSEELGCEEEESFNKVREDGKSGIKCIFRPGRAAKWLCNKYLGEREWPTPAPEDCPPSRLKTLEILENDAIDTFQRLAMGHSHLAMGLERLYLRSTTENDFVLTPESIFPQLFPAMHNLKHLQLILDYPFDDGTILPTLHRSLPPNLEALEFRGPVSLAADARFDDWIAAFGDPEFLPALKRLSFALDLGKEPSEGDAASASRVVEKLLAGAAARGVVVDEFRDPWHGVL